MYEDWRGYLVAGFALVWIANIYMSLYGFIRVGMKKEKLDADIEELRLKKEKEQLRFKSNNHGRQSENIEKHNNGKPK